MLLLLREAGARLGAAISDKRDINVHQQPAESKYQPALTNCFHFSDALFCELRSGGGGPKSREHVVVDGDQRGRRAAAAAAAPIGRVIARAE